MSATHLCPHCGNLTAPKPTADADTRPMRVRVLERVAQEIEGCPEEAWRFFQILASTKHEYRFGTVKELAKEVGVHPSTLVSRFFRAGLPTPKDYLDGALLLRVLVFSKGGDVSVARVADELRCSSPQSLTRTVRRLTGKVASQFVRDTTLDAQIEHFITTLVRPYAHVWRTFSPLATVPLTRESAERAA
jgi:AraC-like DNA-binding protein